MKVNPDVAGAIQAQVDLLADKGIDKIILLSHLQSSNENLELAPLLRGVDLLEPSPPEGPISCGHLSALTVGLPLATAPAAVGRRQLELMPVLSHGTPRDLDGFGRQALDQLLVSERVGRVLRRH